MRNCLLILLYIVCSGVLHAQEKFTVSGHIKDSATGEELVGASYYAAEAKSGGMANDYGFYSLTVPPGNHTLCFSY